MNHAPIILFVYNRPEYTAKVLDALMQNPEAKDSSLYIFADGPKAKASEKEKENIQQVNAIIHQAKGFQSVQIIKASANKGLANSILEGIHSVTKSHDRFIVLEDDIVPAVGFLGYMNAALTLYQHQENVMHISAYLPPIDKILPETFFRRTIACWGWASWTRAWKNIETNPQKLLDEIKSRDLVSLFNMDNSFPFTDHLTWNIEGDIYSWAIKWQATVFLKEGFCLSPKKSLVQNIGLNNTGTFSQAIDYENYHIEQPISQINVQSIPLVFSTEARQAIVQFYQQRKHPGILYRLKRRVNNFWNK